MYGEFYHAVFWDCISMYIHVGIRFDPGIFTGPLMVSICSKLHFKFVSHWVCMYGMRSTRVRLALETPRPYAVYLEDHGFTEKTHTFRDKMIWARAMSAFYLLRHSNARWVIRYNLKVSMF